MHQGKELLKALTQPSIARIHWLRAPGLPRLLLRAASSPLLRLRAWRSPALWPAPMPGDPDRVPGAGRRHGAKAPGQTECSRRGARTRTGAPQATCCAPRKLRKDQGRREMVASVAWGLRAVCRRSRAASPAAEPLTRQSCVRLAHSNPRRWRCGCCRPSPLSVVLLELHCLGRAGADDCCAAQLPGDTTLAVKIGGQQQAAVPAPSCGARPEMPSLGLPPKEGGGMRRAMTCRWLRRTVSRISCLLACYQCSCTVNIDGVRAACCRSSHMNPVGGMYQDWEATAKLSKPPFEGAAANMHA